MQFHLIYTSLHKLKSGNWKFINSRGITRSNIIRHWPKSTFICIRYSYDIPIYQMDLDVYNCCLVNEWKVNDDRWTKRQTGVKLYVPGHFMAETKLITKWNLTEVDLSVLNKKLHLTQRHLHFLPISNFHFFSSFFVFLLFPLFFFLLSLLFFWIYFLESS